MRRLLFAVLFIVPLPVVAAGFDGRWSVSIITESGDCDRGYRYDVRIENGVLRYDGEGSFVFSGKVAPNGAVTVAVSKGNQDARGTGHLTARAGSGTWRGRASSGDCAGRWEAERR